MCYSTFAPKDLKQRRLCSRIFAATPPQLNNNKTGQPVDESLTQNTTTQPTSNNKISPIGNYHAAAKSKHSSTSLASDLPMACDSVAWCRTQHTLSSSRIAHHRKCISLGKRYEILKKFLGYALHSRDLC
ncbi:PREDICTED: uncharacterized protein LOC108359697 [Rhagoletis zephyria]|uniref:uncharacterized protein LOC108359697 n=1 Tax=Rhagoletis zephyria TaxID=28612 RepID=UPI0008116358|nr:PREDICTED: uncharacterized protein LOC108359697 [Rhagoletis zephyria]